MTQSVIKCVTITDWIAYSDSVSLLSERWDRIFWRTVWRFGNKVSEEYEAKPPENWIYIELFHLLILGLSMLCSFTEFLALCSSLFWFDGTLII